MLRALLPLLPVLKTAGALARAKIAQGQRDRQQKHGAGASEEAEEGEEGEEEQEGQEGQAQEGDAAIPRASTGPSLPAARRADPRVPPGLRSQGADDDDEIVINSMPSCCIGVLDKTPRGHGSVAAGPGASDWEEFEDDTSGHKYW